MMLSKIVERKVVTNTGELRSTSRGLVRARRRRGLGNKFSRTSAETDADRSRGAAASEDAGPRDVSGRVNRILDIAIIDTD